MARFPCPYLHGEVELTEERERHIAEHHPDLLPAHRRCIMETLAEPDQVRRSLRMGNARLFARWFDDVGSGKNVVVVVVSDSEPNERHWVITAYIAGKLAQGEIEWSKK